MEINLRLIPPCRLESTWISAAKPMHLGRDFLFRGKQAASILWISATKPTPRPPSLDRSLETTSTFQRSMSHKRQPQHGTLPSSMFKFMSQCLESNRNGPFEWFWWFQSNLRVVWENYERIDRSWGYFLVRR